MTGKLKVPDWAWTAVFVAVLVAMGIVVGHAVWPRTQTVSTEAWGRICEVQERQLVADNGTVPTTGTGASDVPGMPIKYFDKNHDIGVVSNSWPQELSAGSSFPSDDQQRLGTVDVSPIGNITYSMTGLPRSASNMAVAQALTRLFINSLGAKDVTCSPTYWVGPNLPGEMETLMITGVDGAVTTAVLAVVGDPKARVVIFTRGNAQVPTDENAVLQLGLSMRHSSAAS